MRGANFGISAIYFSDLRPELYHDFSASLIDRHCRPTSTARDEGQPQADHSPPANHECEVRTLASAPYTSATYGRSCTMTFLRRSLIGTADRLRRPATKGNRKRIIRRQQIMNARCELWHQRHILQRLTAGVVP